MKKFFSSLSLGLKSDTFYDGAERLCSCLKAAEKKIAYVASETTKLDKLKQQLSLTLHYKDAMESITAETKALRSNGAALRHQIRGFMKYGSETKQACATRLMEIAEEYGPFNRLTVRECRTAAEMLLRDFGSEQAQADIAKLNGVPEIVEQLADSLSTLREKQAMIDAAIAASVKPESVRDLKLGIANTVNNIMEYLKGNVKAQPEMYGALLDQLSTILADANARKRKAGHQLSVVTDEVATEIPA